MHGEVGLLRFCLPEDRAAVVLRDELLSIRIIELHILHEGVAGVADREMRSGLLCNQNRHQGTDAVALCHPVGAGVRSDRELAHRQALLLPEDHLAHECTALLRVREIRAAVGGDAAILEAYPKIPELEALDKHRADVQHAGGAFELRGGEDLAKRDIHVRETVLKIRLAGRIRQQVELHAEVGCIALSQDMDGARLVEGGDQTLLHRTVRRGGQGVDRLRFVENRLEIRADRRERPGNDREGALFLEHEFMYEQLDAVLVVSVNLRLMRREAKPRGLLHRLERRRAEAFHHDRPRVTADLVPIGTENPALLLEHADADAVAHHKGEVVAVVEIHLRVRALVELAAPARGARQEMLRAQRDREVEAILREECRGALHHALEACRVAELNDRFLLVRLALDAEAVLKSLVPGPRHAVNAVVGQLRDKFRRPEGGVRNIVAEAADVGRIEEVVVEDQLTRVRTRRDVHRIHLPTQEILGIIVGVAVEDVTELLRIYLFLILVRRGKHAVDLHEGLEHADDVLEIMLVR